MLQTNKNSLSVTEIIVEKLFGIYNYNVPLNNINGIDKLLIIYGDNGSGKTTILKLLFYLLSTKDKSGYKTKIAQTKFKTFAVKFRNGIEIGATRRTTSFGGFKYYISQDNKIIHSVNLKANPDNAIQLEKGSKEDLEFLKILSFIKELNITTFFLSDDRKILNSKTSLEYDDYNPINLLSNDSEIILSNSYDRIKLKRTLNEKRLYLEPTIERLIDWIKSKIISGSRVGEQNSQNIFSDIIKNYIKLSETVTNIKDKNTIINDINNLELKLPSFVNLGFLENIDLKTIKSSVNKAKTEEQLKFLNTVVSPYIESINAKLKALEKVEKTINLFITIINDYYSNKEIRFHLNTGLTLYQKNDKKQLEEIEFDWLSSGEKQLLLLLINSITSADDATIFIIDEPEISLNIKWQRKLIQTLLKFSEDKNTQFILATHSFELLSAYNQSTTKLISK